MTIQAVNPADSRPPVGNYHHGMIAPAGRLLFISGQIPELPTGKIPSGFEAQCNAVWDNIERVLRAAEATFSSIVKVTTYLTDRSQGELNGAIRRRRLGEHAPALTVVVANTLDPVWLLEIEVVAAIPEHCRS